MRTFLFFLAVIFHLTACSSGSKSSSDNVFGDEIIHGSGSDAGGDAFDIAAPSARILFPPPSALTGADTVTITGTAADASSIASIVVNGVRATTDNNFLTWRVRVPLSSGANTLEVASTDILGNRDAVAATTVVVNNPVFTSPFSISIDDANNRLVLVDSTLAALVTSDLVSGQRTIVSSADTGQGPALVTPVGVTVDAANSRAIVVDPSLLALLSVDLSSGNRTIISNTTLGAGPDFQSPDQIALDPARNQALVTELAPAAVYTVNLTTGDRAILADANTGAGDDLQLPGSIVVDTANNRALVVDIIAQAVIAVDLTSGDRSVVSSATTGAGPPLLTPAGITIDPSNDQIIVSDVESIALFSIDPSNGNRTIISSATQGSGPLLAFPLALVADASARSFVVDTDLSTVLEVDNSSGDRSSLSDAGIGSGPEFASPFSIDIDRTNNEALVTDVANGALYGVSINSGTRRVISDDVTGTGQQLLFPTSVSLQRTGTDAIILDVNRPAIISIDLTSGDRTVVSDASNGDGIPLLSPLRGALDTENNRLLAANPDNVDDNAFVLSVDLGTGDRVILSRGERGSLPNLIPAIGNGSAFNFPQSIAVDSANQLGYVVDTTLDSLITVDLNTGDRSNGPVGTGTTFPFITQTPLPGNGFTAPFQDVTLTPNEAIVSDASQRSVYGFDTSSGARRVISDSDTGVGTDLQSPVSIAFDPATSTLFVVDGALFALIAIEPVSGDRVIVSR